jgi:hypothetical protein
MFGFLTNVKSRIVFKLILFWNRFDLKPFKFNQWKLPLLFCFRSICTNSLIAGIPVNSVSGGFQVNSDNIRVGQEVFFSFDGIDNCGQGFVLEYNFGPNSNQTEVFEIVMSNSIPSLQIPISFNTPGAVNVTLGITQSQCINNYGFPFTLRINVLPESVPTLSQWALKLLTLFIIIFAVVSIRNSLFQSAKNA